MSSNGSPRKTLHTVPAKEPKKAPAGAGVSRAEVDMLRQKIVDLVSDKPEKAVIILSDWIKQAEKSRRKAG